MSHLFKYPRTQHIEGSKLQPGDEDLESVPFRSVGGEWVVIEEKLDGANSGISFGEEGCLLLQSRGHFLDGGPREKHFALLKTWANTHRQALWEILGRRYVMYGEWVYAKHTIFYDMLPHYFMEFDVLEKEEGQFLSTERRKALLGGSPVVSVPVIYSGPAAGCGDLRGLVGDSLYKSGGWKERLAAAAVSRGIEPGAVLQETDGSERMEGLYIKVENSGRVTGRFKFIRASFLDAVAESGSHWMDRPIVPNQLGPGVDIFSG
jgi:hypothetical protein